MKKVKIAIQGEFGAYSHIAANNLYKDAEINCDRNVSIARFTSPVDHNHHPPETGIAKISNASTIATNLLLTLNRFWRFLVLLIGIRFDPLLIHQTQRFQPSMTLILGKLDRHILPVRELMMLASYRVAY